MTGTVSHRLWRRPVAASLVPWLRGYGPTRFLDSATPRSGQQAALGADVCDFMDALGIQQATLAGYDWGGRAACIAAALWPERVRGLVSITGYNIQNIANSGRPGSAAAEHRYWYQWYFHTERGRAGLTQNRRDICTVAVAALVAELALRRCHLRGHSAELRQSRLRRSDDPVLSPSLWRRAWRPCVRAARAISRRATEDHSSHDRAAWCGRWRRPAGKLRAPRAAFHRALRAARGTRGGPFPVARDTRCRCAGGARSARPGIGSASPRRRDRRNAHGWKQRLSGRARQEPGELHAAYPDHVPRARRLCASRSPIGRARRAALHLARDLCAVPPPRVRSGAARHRQERHCRDHGTEYPGDGGGGVRRADVRCGAEHAEHAAGRRDDCLHAAPWRRARVDHRPRVLGDDRKGADPAGRFPRW